MTRVTMLNFNKIIKAHYVTGTITEEVKTTITTTATTAVTNSNPTNITTQESTTTERPKEDLLSTEQIRENIANNQTKLDDIISRNKVERGETNNEKAEQALSESKNSPTTNPPTTTSSGIASTSTENTSSSSNSNDQSLEDILSKVEKPTVIPQIGLNNQALDDVMLRIKASCKLVGQQVAEKLQQREVPLDETQKATERQEALYNRLHEFVDFFNITTTVRNIALTLGIGYTLYHILRYREIPLGGFLKGFMSGNIPAPSIPPDITNTNHITISMPPLSSTADAVRNTGLTNMISHALESSPF